MSDREWFTPARLAELALPGLPATKANVIAMADRQEWRRPEWEGQRWRRRAGRGGGYEYHVGVLPLFAKLKLLALDAEAPAADPHEKSKGELRNGELWRWFDALPEHKKAAARQRAEALDAVELLVRTGTRRTTAACLVAREAGIAVSGLYRWTDLVIGVDRPDWLPRLAPRHAGRQGSVECSPEAWEFIKADYLRLEKPCLTDCYRRLEMTAPGKGWTIPSRSTLQRRIDAIPPEQVTLARDGIDALKRLYPAQVRDRSGFHALEAINLDGHTWDVFVRWPDGTVARPTTVAIQDLYSGRILAWRTDQTLHSGLVRLAIGDMVELWGIPDHCWFDNGRENASKWISGGAPNRYRFTVRDEDPLGLLPQLGVEVHWTTPYSGQSKPIERGFRDFAQNLAKHPAFAGAWTGNTPMAKPENYASSAVPLATFEQVIAVGIVEHNSRIGRKSRVCGGKLSFAQAFDQSVAAGAPIRRATAEQRRLWLLAAEALRVSRRDGTVEIEGNRYWNDALLPFRGQTVVARFDPAALHQAVHVYRMDGGYLCAAECHAAVGFADVDAAREHNRARRTWMRASREVLDAERRMTIEQVAAAMPKAPAEVPPEPRVVRPVFGANYAAALQAQDAPADDDGITEGDRLMLRAFAMRHEELRLRVVPNEE